MKAVSKLAVSFSLVALASVTASAKTDEQAYLSSCRQVPGVPLPVSVVKPAVGAEYTGTTVQLEFVVGATGLPDSFIVKSAADDTVARAVVQAVKRWKFAPARKDGVPVATKVALPVKIVDEASADASASS